MGKGSTQRPTDKSRFDNNYDNIFKKKKKKEDKINDKKDK